MTQEELTARAKLSKRLLDRIESFKFVREGVPETDPQWAYYTGVMQLLEEERQKLNETEGE